MEEKICFYKEEKYSVRNNGEIYRHAQVGQKLRPLDNKWTFGTTSQSHGYFTISGVPVHRIVATAFHGLTPSEKHIVDHIDTNRQNNRPENLRWLTRLENLVLNPITAKRIIRVCGSIEAFLENPAKFKDLFAETNFSWMGAVTAEEGKLTLERLLEWAKSDEESSGKSLDLWALNHRIWISEQIIKDKEISEITVSLTPDAVQRNWRIPSEFPSCPQNYAKDPISLYAKQLTPGFVFCKNDIYTTVVVKSAISKDGRSLFVISESKGDIKPWSLAEITFENAKFVHTSRHKYFSEAGVEKQFCLLQGLEWHGEDSIDDYT